MEDNVSKIKDRLNIAEVVGGYVKLQKAGVNLKGRCPFHNEKTPSFFVSPDRQTWHCFGCNEGGDMFTFIQKIEGVDFPESLRILAQRAGVELKFDSSRSSENKTDDKTLLYEICELATKFFEKQLHHSSLGKRALQYLYDRGVAPATVVEFRLGFAPNDWRALSNFLKTQGYSAKDIIASGVSIRKDSGQDDFYDRFRCRIMFPTTDPFDRVVGFSARLFEAPGDNGLDKDQSVGAKYINTPQTLIYDKSRILYGLSKAKLEIKKADQCILVEGNMDALMSYQAGVRNVVASSGTALTPLHLRLLQRFTNNLGFCFDADQAGAQATRRGIGLALSNNFNIRVLELRDKECKDPADYVKKYGPIWADVVASSKPVLNYYFDRAREGFDPSVAEHKKSMLSVVGPFINRLASHVERAHWVSQLASLFRTKDEIVQADLLQVKDDLEVYDSRAESGSGQPTSTLAAVDPALAGKSGVDPLSEIFLSLVLKYPLEFKARSEKLDLIALHPTVAKILVRLKEDPTKSFEGPEGMILELANLRASEFWQEFKDDQAGPEMENLIRTVQKRNISQRLNQLEFEIKAAEAAKDQPRLATLASQFTQLTNELLKIENQTVQIK